MTRDIDIAEAFSLENPLFVDLRSEKEFLLDHAPKAINLPVFNDKERAVVGTAYQKFGSQEAHFLGLEYVSPKLPDMMRTLFALSQKGQVVLYCWRGGMRSKAIAEVADLMHIKVYRLIKGYQAYRHFINAYWQQAFPFQVIVLHGLTGVGKTDLLKNLFHKGMQVLDSEALACHRGSAFGRVGKPLPPSQKYFETQCYAQLTGYDKKKPVFIEGESKKIGSIMLPKSLFFAMETGKHFLVTDTLANRVNRILAEYEPEQNISTIAAALETLSDALGKKKVNALSQMLNLGLSRTVVECLLQNYYDPLYRYPEKKRQGYDMIVETSQMEEAALQIQEFLFSGGK